MHKVLMSGDEAIARGAYEAGCLVAAAYPGTPSTEILEAAAAYKEINSRWSANEKVALEIAGGASLGGVRALAAMKHVGLNVAADPLCTLGYTGVAGGLVVVTADDPGCHSSQNEQDNRLYAPLAKILMLEPADSQECLDYTKAAFELSERFDSPVLLRVTTRVCHSKSLVTPAGRREQPPKPYERNPQKNAMMPAHARARHVAVEEKLTLAELAANASPLNRLEWGRDKRVGVVASGVSYLHAREVFGDSVSYLKLGFTHPLPRKLMDTFGRGVDRIYVIEEGEPYLENAMKALGFDVLGKELLPLVGELDAGLLRRAFLPEPETRRRRSDLVAPPRPPVLCPGCPHRGFFHVLGRKRREAVVVGDIGCYTLGLQPPLNGLEIAICMGAGFSAAIGLAQALEMTGDARKVFGVMGDSTFFHSGLSGLTDAVHAQSNLCLCVLDNHITAMTGHQENPGTGNDLMGRPAQPIDIPTVIRAMGVPEDRLTVVDPLDKAALEAAVNNSLAVQGLSVIVARRPCVLIKEVRKTLEGRRCRVNPEACGQCRACLKIGCPAISFREERAHIDQAVCVGCAYCQKVCKFEAIVKAEEAGQ